MFHRLVFLIIVVIALPVAAEYRSASELFDAMLDAERKRAEGVSDYVMDVTVMGQKTMQYYERMEVDAADGRSLQLFQLVPVAGGKRLTGDFGGMQTGLMKETAENDYTTMLAERAELAGRESIDGRSAYLVKADDLNITQKADGQEFVIRSIHMWVDTENLVMKKMRMDGAATQDGQSREIYIERVDQDHRSVPGSGLILPYRTIMQMGGMMGPKEQKEMEKAREQLAELDRQMASMPEDQKKMMQNMMGGQIETMRKMVEGGTLELETIVHEIRVNQGIEAASSSNASPNKLGDLIEQARSDQAAQRQDAESLEQARQACLQRKVEEAQAGKKKKKRFGKLLGAVKNIAGRHGGDDLADDISRVSSEVYAADATSGDLKSAAEALGITEDDVAACENPR